MMRLTTEKDPRSGQLTAGIKQCDACGVEQYLKRPRRWDICLCCERKQGYAEGRRVAPKQEKKQCYINYCDECHRVFEVASRNLWKQKHCSSKCAGKKNIGRAPANKIWEDKKERTTYYYRKYYADPNIRLAKLMRSRIKCVLRTQLNRKKQKYKQVAHTEELLGCTIEELKIYLESKFQEGMTWENHTHDGWHIDHIIPISKFDLTDEVQMKKACHYTNLQPLWAGDNLKKHAKILSEVLVNE